jgi:DNA-binding NarL/FixJ family response regulator
MTIRVLLADDHRILVDGLMSLLERQGDIDVVGVAKDGLEVVAMVERHRPDVVLLDISMPRLNGIDAARRILRDHPDTKIAMLSMHADRAYVQESLRVGARGYILKESAVREVLHAVEAVMRGERFLSQSVRDQVLDDYVELVRDARDPAGSPLSPREREVLQLLAEGHSTKEMASTLSISAKTVESHRKQMMDKLGMHSVAELTKYAIREGLTALD